MPYGARVGDPGARGRGAPCLIPWSGCVSCLGICLQKKKEEGIASLSIGADLVTYFFIPPRDRFGFVCTLCSCREGLGASTGRAPCPPLCSASVIMSYNRDATAYCVFNLSPLITLCNTYVHSPPLLLLGRGRGRLGLLRGLGLVQHILHGAPLVHAVGHLCVCVWTSTDRNGVRGAARSGAVRWVDRGSTTHNLAYQPLINWSYVRTLTWRGGRSALLIWRGGRSGLPCAAGCTPPLAASMSRIFFAWWW